jgi:type I restriction enzyme R subunit
VKVLKLDPFNQMGSPVELLGAFGGKNGYAEAVKHLEDALYQQIS